MPSDTQIVALFTGDSITDAGRDTVPDGPLGFGYVRQISERAAQSTMDIRVINTGVSGDRVGDLKSRWNADIIQHAPDVLTILVGINDMWRRFDSGEPTTAAAFRATYDTLLADATKLLNLKALVIMEPFLVPVSDEQATWHETDLNEKIAVVRDLARQYSATLIPLSDVFAEQAAARGARELVDDGIHPTMMGHEVIAQAWWSRVVPGLAED